MLKDDEGSMSENKSDNPQLRLHITKPDDVQILSTYIQDMIIRPCDMAFLKSQKRFALVGHRFCWECDDKNQRILCGFHFDYVENIQYRDIDPKYNHAFLNLLAIRFEPQDKPSGIITFLFAQKGEIKLNIDAVQAYLRDMGARVKASQRPQHSDLKS